MPTVVLVRVGVVSGVRMAWMRRLVLLANETKKAAPDDGGAPKCCVHWTDAALVSRSVLYTAGAPVSIGVFWKTRNAAAPKPLVLRP